VAAGAQHDRLVEALAELRSEIGRRPAETADEQRVPRLRGNCLLDADEGRRVRELGLGLARLAAAARAERPVAGLPESAILGSVGGAEWVMRRELASGRPGRLATLMPDLVHLVTLAYLGRAGASAAEARSRELIGGDA
jgi:hypothetical protein